jgi:hypothetical protein
MATMFPHAQTVRWWISGQSNFVFQDLHSSQQRT